MADIDEPIKIPLVFIRSLSWTDWDVLFRNNGWLNPEQCARLWRMTDRQDAPPEAIQLTVKREDVMRIWPPKKKRMWRQ